MFNAYINGLGNISPQKTYDNSIFLEEILETEGDFLYCQEPKYKEFINPRLVRRMSRIVRMGTAAANIALADAVTESVDAVLTGTALGCLLDTERFLTDLIKNDEKLLAPTAFIQSTHNTVGGRIALVNKQTCYNFTYVHRGFSFESALLDALMLLKDNDAQKVLLGGVDELTKNSETLFLRLGCTKSESLNNTDTQIQAKAKNETKSPGTRLGEGAAFFVLENEPSENCYAVVKGLSMVYKPEGRGSIRAELAQFLDELGLQASDIDLVLFGADADRRFDWHYDTVKEAFFSKTASAYYKHLSGEYATSSSFALWAAANILKQQNVPDVLGADLQKDKEIRNILIYDQHQGMHHSLIFLSKC